MKKLLSLLLAFAMILSLAGCAEKEPEPVEYPDFKALLTDETVDYSADKVDTYENLKNLHIYDTDVPALYKYFEGIVDIGVAFTSNQIAAFGTEGLDLTQPSGDNNINVMKGILKHYNMYVLGNEMKPDHINPAPGVYNFDNGDKFVEFGKAADAKLRGHTLLWHSQVPQWWFKADPNDSSSLADCQAKGTLATSEQLVERIETYITDVMTHFKDDVKIWDVCNEVLNADSIRRLGDDSYWADIVGDLDGNGFYDDYVEIAFNAARKAGGEDQILMINDFNMEWQDSKTKAMYDMVERMLRKGVRIDGVGFQSHISVDCNVAAYRKNIEKIASLSEIYDECFPEYKGNFRVQITELDMNMFVGANADGGFYHWSDEEFEQQAKKYAELFEMFLDFADEGKIDAILFWGTDDENSWLNSTPKMRTNAALLAKRETYVLKPCFWSVAKTSFNHKK